MGKPLSQQTAQDGLGAPPLWGCVSSWLALIKALANGSEWPVHSHLLHDPVCVTSEQSRPDSPMNA